MDDQRPGKALVSRQQRLSRDHNATQKHVINQIREDFFASPRVAEIVDALLKKAAIEIYSEATHFIFELVQNADDNDYAPSVEPCLYFDATDCSIEIRCNEVGFTAANVQAICNVDKSTKKSKDSIGEKGIGFKSVFKVADSVHVRSNGFEFLLDKNNGPFGMVMPIWQEISSGQNDTDDTIFLLTLSPECKALAVHVDLEEMKPTILLFLRKLLRIEVRTPSFGRVIKCRARGHSVIKILTRQWGDYEGPQKASQQYLVVRRVAQGFAQEQRRPGGSRSEVALAFPFKDANNNADEDEDDDVNEYENDDKDENGDEDEDNSGDSRKDGSEDNDDGLETQDVHAFLPIRDYGFKFIIQADFALTASRQEIDATSAWNKSLKQDIVLAFKDAIDKMNNSRQFRFTWMRYLPNSNLPKSFFSSLGKSPTSIVDYLEDHKILWSQSNRLEAPDSLIEVPDEFRSRNNTALLPDDKIPGKSQLSFQYASTDVAILKHQFGRLDVLDQDLFLEVLKDMGVQDTQTPEWHEDIAKILRSLDFQDIYDLPLIPLEGDHPKWVSAREIRSRPVHRKRNMGDLQVPPALDLRFVQTSAAKNKHRAALFEKLGVLPCNARAICDTIVLVHRSGKSLSVREMVLQTKFLFKHREKYHSPDIWFAQERAQERPKSSATVTLKGNELYFDDPRLVTPVSEVFKCCSGIKFLHSSYLADDPDVDQDQWLDWLMETFGISAIMRVVKITTSPRGQKRTPSPEFEEWAEESTIGSFVDIIIDNWDKYQENLSVVDDILRGRLADTILPSRSLVAKARAFGVKKEDWCFLQIDFSQRDECQLLRLNQYGLITSLSSQFYIIIIRYLRRHTKLSDLSLVHSVYRALQGCSDVVSIRNAFADEDLVAMTTYPGSSPVLKWVPVKGCVWKGPTCLRFNRPLLVQYPDCKDLFCATLTVQEGTTLLTVVTDLCSFARRKSAEVKPEDFKPLLFELSKFIQRSQADNDLGEQDCLSRLRGLAIFPVKKRYEEPAILVEDGDLSERGFIFVPDRADLYELFRKRVPILDFSVEEIASLMPLIINFLRPRLLSREVQRTFVHEGQQRIHKCLRKDLRKKSSELFRCVRHYTNRSLAAPEIQGNLHKKLQKISVIEVEKVECVQSIYKTSTKTSGDAVLKNTVDRFKIYITKDKELQTKALCHSIPERLVKELGLSADARAIIQTILRLQQPMLADILDESGIARLPDEPRGSTRAPSALAASDAANETNDDEDLMISSTERASEGFGRTQRSSASKSVTLTRSSSEEDIASSETSSNRSSSSRSTTGTNIATFDLPVRNRSPLPSGSTSTFRSSSRDDALRASSNNPFANHRSSPHVTVAFGSACASAYIPNPVFDNAPTVGVSRTAISSKPEQLEARPSSTNVALASQRRRQSAPGQTADELSGPSTLHQSICERARKFDFGAVHLISTETPIYRAPLQSATEPWPYYTHATIGFLGEFFVVNILTKFLPSFTLDNWTSRLRKRAQACDGFQHISPYEVPEISDITYEDTQGKLTSWLVNRGYTYAEGWVGQKRTFYIEVKTTIRDCATPFIMSSYQVEHAERWTHWHARKGKNREPQQEQDATKVSIYLVIRVFRILEECRDLCVYMDPHALKNQGKLEMKANKYAVIPRTGWTEPGRGIDNEDLGDLDNSDTSDDSDEDGGVLELWPKKARALVALGEALELHNRRQTLSPSLRVCGEAKVVAQVMEKVMEEITVN